MNQLEAVITVLTLVGSAVTLCGVVIRIFVVLHKLKAENDKQISDLKYEIQTRIGMINQVNDSVTHLKARLLQDIGRNSSSIRKIEVFLAKTTAFEPDDD